VPRFVIQHHQATALHYDFRLEVDGVLRSWAVPKGLSTDPAVKRLAVEVGDHALEHAEFEGPAGRGGVIIWDEGDYRNLDEERSMDAALRDGHAKVWLEGRKLRGGWTLQRTDTGDRPQWLVIKRRDGEADAARDVTADEPASVRSGRTLRDVVAEARHT